MLLNLGDLVLSIQFIVIVLIIDYIDYLEADAGEVGLFRQSWDVALCRGDQPRSHNRT